MMFPMFLRGFSELLRVVWCLFSMASHLREFHGVLVCNSGDAVFTGIECMSVEIDALEPCNVIVVQVIAFPAHHITIIR